MKTYEVELRALLTEEQYKSLSNHFESLVKGEKNDNETYAFLTNDINIKVKNMVSKGTAKMVLKDGAEFKQQTNEYEVRIDPRDVEQAVAFITAIGYKRHIPSFQKRVDYKLGEIMVSIKDETHWRHHIEAEIVVSKKSEISAAKKRLQAFFKKFGLTAMTEEQGKALTNAALKKFGIDQI